MTPHALDAHGAMAAALFCEPQSQIGRDVIARFGGSGLAVLPQPAELSRRIAAIGQGMAQGNEPERACSNCWLSSPAPTRPAPPPICAS